MLSFIILILIAGPTLCAVTVILTHRVDSKLERQELDNRREALVAGETTLTVALDAVEGREWVVAERERMQREGAGRENALLQERRLELSRQAHDFDDLVKAQIHLVEDDTTIIDIWKEA